MSKDDRTRRLEALNGGPLKSQPAGKPASSAAASSAAASSAAASSAAASSAAASSAAASSTGSRDSGSGIAVSRLFRTIEPGAAGGAVRLEDAAPGQSHSAGGGECWLVEQSVEQAAPWAPAAFLRVQAGWGGGIGRRAARRAGCPLGGLHHLLFVDLETTGLSDCPLFLIGTLQWEEGRFVIRQYFARRPAEERHALAEYARIAAKFPALVTFNGHRFDEPFLRSRAAVHNVSLPRVHGHLDLIQPARRHLRGSLPDCRLQTLEKELCGRRRVGDLPGREIPAAYAAFVQTGDASQVGAILEHNRLDLLTMLDLLDRIPLGP